MVDPSISRPSVDVINTDGIQHPRTTSRIEIMTHASAFESRYITDGNIQHKGNVCFLISQRCVLKTDAISFSGTLVSTYKNTQLQNLKDLKVVL